MAKGKRNSEKAAHCIVLPFPGQGHVNPMLQFSKRLVQKGVKVTLVLTRFIWAKSFVGESVPNLAFDVDVETISDGYDEGGFAQAESEAAYLERFRVVGSETLNSLIEKLKFKSSTSDQYGPVDCIIYDSFFPWALDVAKKWGILGAAFFTMSCAVNNIYYSIYRGMMKLPISDPDSVTVPGLTFPLQSSDLPSLVHHYGSFPGFLDMAVNQFSNIEEVDWMFCNSFYKLEDEVVDWMAKTCAVRTIGPTLPSAYLDKRLGNDRDYGLNIFNPVAAACIEWLDDKPDESVVYASYGTFAQLQPHQIEEIAWGLRRSNANFIMVVRESEQPKLPHNFKEETAEKGLVVSWCPQLEVLSHRAVGCFLTHGGWNSTLEGLSLGVPMVVAPLLFDQPTSGKFVEDVWGIGLKAPADEKGIASREVIDRCIREVMRGDDSDRSKQIKSNAEKWKHLAREAVGEGGSSDKSIVEFVAKLSRG